LKCLSVKPKGCELQVFGIDFAGVGVDEASTTTAAPTAAVAAPSSGESTILFRRIDKLEGEVSLLKTQMETMRTQFASAMTMLNSSTPPKPPTPPPKMTTVFVYGTLKRGLYNCEKYLSPSSSLGGSATFLGSCKTVEEKRLVILDFGVPGIISNDVCDIVGGLCVEGELFDVDDVKLELLDGLEGVGLTEEQAGWCRYERRKIAVEMVDGGGSRNAEFYLMVGVDKGKNEFERMAARIAKDGYLESYTKEIHDSEYVTRKDRDGEPIG